MLEKNTSYIELSKEALQFNVNFLKSEMGENVLISSVVKGNAYGHGIESYIPLAQECGLNHFCVYSAFEAKRVQKSLIENATILIMGYMSEKHIVWAIENNIEFFVSDLVCLKTAINYAKELKSKCLIHLELETGMHRTGIEEECIKEKVLPLLLKEKEYYELKGICTHFAGAEDITNYFRLRKQKESFIRIRNLIHDYGLREKYTHTSCSAAALRFKEMRYNMVRIGILQYGFWPSPEIKIQYLLENGLDYFYLKRIITWKSKIIQVKTTPKGAFIGYGEAYRADAEMCVGIVPVGYANGYSRALSNSGTVLIHNKRALVLGNINMNLMIVDLRNIPEAAVGSEVILIGSQGNSEITVASFGELSNQLNYELLTRLPIDIPRNVVE